MTGRQQLVYASLSAKSKEIADLYACALRTLSDNGNVGRIFLAAHALREMTGDLPKVVDLPILSSLGRLGDQVNGLQAAWVSGLQSSCHRDGQWNGSIDRELQRLLGKLHDFFVWFRENRPKRRDVVTNLFRATDPAGLPLPEALERPRTDRWLALQDYFVRVAHRGQTTKEEFDAHVEELERFLIDMLSRQPSEDFSAIDAILLEASDD